MWRRLLWWWRRKQEEQDLHEELQSHLAIEAREQSGKEPGFAARRAFGNVTLIQEATRDVWRIVWLDQLWQDVRYGLRTLRHNPGFTTVVILTLALAIGMNTAVFSVVNAVLLRPLPYPDADRLLWVTTVEARENAEFVTLADFLDWKDQAASLEDMFAYSTNDDSVAAPGNAVRSKIAFVSDDFWKVAGARPAIGRLPKPGERDVALLSDAFFQRWFHGDSSVLERPVLIGQRQVTIAGVLDSTFQFQFPAETLEGEMEGIGVYRTMPISARDRVRGNGIAITPNIVAKLKRGVSLETARAELATIRARYTQGSTMPWDQQELRVQPLQERIVGRQAPLALSILLAAVVFVLLIACANIANLLLARASVRRREVAIRASVGAGRGRVLRQFLAESLVIALLGGIAGVLLARWGIAVILGVIPQAIPRLAETTVDSTVLIFALLASLAAAFLFGIVPAIALWRTDLHDVLKDGTRTASSALGSSRARKLLVVVELALAVVLLNGAGLMVKSFWRMTTHPDGFHPERILTMKVGLTGGSYFEDPPRQRAYVDEFLKTVRSVPGVETVSIMNRSEASPTWEGAPPMPPDKRPFTLSSGVSADYAKLMGLRLVSGRWFTDEEPANAVVINESLARRDLSGQDPIGKRLRWKGTEGTVVGVVADLKYSKLDASPEPEFYVHYSYARRLYSTTVAARVSGDPGMLASTILKLVSGIDKSEPVYGLMTLERALADSIAPRRFNLFLLASFAGAALLLALIGIYGVIAYAVSQRTHEIGVRIALGAQRAQVTGMVMRQGMWMALAGLGLGVVAAAALTRLMESLLYDVKPADPPTFIVVAATFAATACLACCIPALRAARVDPLVALRHE